jgi:hypothetical protein
MKFRILGQNVTNAAWNGNGQTLNYHDSVTMPQTPNGSMVLGYWNVSKQNNDGELTLVSAGPPQPLDVPAGALMPSILVQNWNANTLTLTNTSANSATPIRIEAFGAGIPGVNVQTLSVNAPALQLSTLQAAQGKAPANYAQIVLSNNNNNLSIITLIGGPPDGNGNNAYVFALNYQGPPSPPGYTKVTSGNSLTYQFSWNTSVFVANMSPANSSSVAVSLISL